MKIDYRDSDAIKIHVYSSHEQFTKRMSDKKSLRKSFIHGRDCDEGDRDSRTRQPLV